MKLYIVRHGETLFNYKHLVQGWCDSPLTEKGVMQAKCVGYGLKDIPFQHAFCSTSERTFDTACNIIGEREISLEQRKALKEMHFGSIEGDTMSDEFMKSMRDEGGFRKFGGESLEEAGKRAVQAWETIAKEHPDENVLIVTHGGVIMNGMNMLEPGIVEDMQKKGIYAENCSVSVVDYCDGEMKIEEFCSLEYRQKGEKYYAIS